MKQIYELLKKFEPKMGGNMPVGGGNSGGNNSMNVVGNQGLKWDKNHCGQSVQFENQMSLVILKEAAYVFRTAVGTGGFTSGKHYWEIMPDSRTEN